MALSYKALALLLAYPNDETRSAAPAAARAIVEEGLVSQRVTSAIDKLARELATGDLYDLQERYVHLFDRTRSLSLNLYEHVHGESRDRGPAMVDLVELYRLNGLELSPGELPDYLPAFLEFLSVLPDDESASLIGEAVHVIEALGERLRRRRTPYRAVFGALAELAGERADQAALQALLDEPDDDPDDLEAIDKAWAETPVTFGPDSIQDGQGGGCPKADALVSQMKQGA